MLTSLARFADNYSAAVIENHKQEATPSDPVKGPLWVACAISLLAMGVVCFATVFAFALQIIIG